MICTNILMNPAERITNRATEKFLASLPMISGREARKLYGRSVGDTLCGVNQSIGSDHTYRGRFCVMLPYVQSGIFPATLNTACRWSQRSAKKNILSVAKVVTFEGTPKFWCMEYWRKCCKERTRWLRSKDFPVGVDDMAHRSFSIDFCTLSSSCCCIIVAKLPSLMIMFSFFSRFCT